MENHVISNQNLIIWQFSCIKARHSISQRLETTKKKFQPLNLTNTHRNTTWPPYICFSVLFMFHTTGINILSQFVYSPLLYLSSYGKMFLTQIVNGSDMNYDLWSQTCLMPLDQTTAYEPVPGWLEPHVEGTGYKVSVFHWRNTHGERSPEGTRLKDPSCSMFTCLLSVNATWLRS